MIAEAAETSFVAGVVGWVDLTDAAVGDVIGRLKADHGGAKLVGIRHQVQDEDDHAWLSHPDVRRGLAAVVERGLAFDLLVRCREWPAAIDTVRAFPAGRFVLDHAAKPPLARGITAAWQAGIARLAALPNVGCKVSGLVTEADRRGWRTEQIAPAVRHVVESFGEDRVMFGSDGPVCLLAAAPVTAGKLWGGSAVSACRLPLGNIEC